MVTTEQISLSAKKYAQALIEVAQDNILTNEEILSDLEKVSTILKSSEDLKLTLENPIISKEVKFQILSEVFENELNPKIINFMKILIDKNRFNEFSEIKTCFLNKLDEINNIQTVEIYSAVELNNEYKNRIIQKLSDKLKKNIKPIWQIDENIIAGLIYKINDNVIDTSLKNKFNKLSKNLM